MVSNENLADGAKGISDTAGSWSGGIGEFSVWFSETINGITSWVSRMTWYEMVLIIVLVILAISAWNLKKKLGKRVKPKMSFN